MIPLKVTVMRSEYVIPDNIVLALILGPIGFKLSYFPNADRWLLRLLFFRRHIVFGRRLR